MSPKSPFCSLRFFLWLLILLKQFLNRYFTFKNSDSGDHLFPKPFDEFVPFAQKLLDPSSSEENRNLERTIKRERKTTTFHKPIYYFKINLNLGSLATIFHIVLLKFAWLFSRYHVCFISISPVCLSLSFSFFASQIRILPQKTSNNFRKITK